MEEEINVPRTHDDRNSPRILNLKYSNEAIRRLIGPLGALKRKIEEETGGRISVNDGSLTVVAKNQSVLNKVMEKIDFTVGREIEKGGVYKGIVTSIKEYGAFVEFNGGQQGLLHISELAHKPVSRVSDVVSIGQVLNLMCIGLDVRGNINLSLKATLPKTSTSVQQTPKVWTDKSVESLSSIVIQSAEMEQEDKDNQPAEAVESLSSIVIQSAAECDGADKSSALNHPSKVDAPLDAKKLKIGTELTAKVHQIRAHGLVLDCGSDIRGMYRFETGSGRKFVIGDKLRVKCSSSSGKGIPVMSLVQE
ncbi:polyribonucleotide nucleotidyltransferase [Salvia divinorum]|uniref:Polyribonucleotide nucleotidyltransferase n=1 Tax=Salvia divinorum TaxID=28513 RepID=A0ABD1FZ36_SALDI